MSVHLPNVHQCVWDHVCNRVEMCGFLLCWCSPRVSVNTIDLVGRSWGQLAYDLFSSTMSFTSHVEWSLYFPDLKLLEESGTNLDCRLGYILCSEPSSQWCYGVLGQNCFAILSIMVYRRACDDKNAEVCSSPWETVWGTGVFVYVLMHWTSVHSSGTVPSFLDNVSLVPGARWLDFSQLHLNS